MVSKFVMVTVELVASVVKAAVEGVVVPIAVALIPVAVVVRLLAAMSKLFIPVEIVDPERPVKFNPPEVAVKLSAPVVCVKPLDAVNSPADVIAPVPFVTILPDVVSVPFSLMVNFETPPD